MEEEEKNAIDKEIQNLNKKIDNYNILYDNLTIKKKKIEIDIQIDPKDIDELEKAKNEFEKYLLLLDKKETMVYWEIPIRNENIIIKYEKNSQLFRDNTNKIYFKVNEINDEFKNKFSLSNNKFLNFFKKKKNEEKNIEDYIYFNEAKKVEINKYSITKNDEFLEKIKEFAIEEIVFSSVLFKEKHINELV